MSKNNLDNVTASDLKAHLGDVLLNDLIKERRSYRRWTILKRFLLSGTGLALFGMYVMFQAEQAGFHIIPSKDMVAVVDIEGEIGAGKPASAAEVIASLQSACEKPNVKGIIIALDTPGGQPNESEMINRYMEQCRALHHKRIVGVVKNMAASAGYLIAINTDKIYAGRYSTVGSIGVIMKGWDVHRLMEKYDISQRVFASGEHKDAMDPFSPMSNESGVRIMSLVNSMADVFKNEVKRKRGVRLKQDVDVFDGFVWSGSQAKEIGLVDDIGTVEEVATKEFGVKPYDFGPHRRGGFGPFASFEAGVADMIVEKLISKMDGATPVLR